jgi:23S rRNA G2445 N2-methylase RlmL
MCGSGTLLIEAAAIAEDLAPGLLRDPRARPWPFEAWHDFDAVSWRGALEEAKGARRSWRGAALGNDIHSGALSLARACAEAAGVAHAMKLHAGDCARWALPAPPTLVVANPPWGQRIGGGGDDDSDDRDDRGNSRERRQQQPSSSAAAPASEARAAWRSLGAFLRASCPGTTAWVLSGAPELTAELGMRSWKRRKVKLGGVGAAWLAYDVLERQQQDGEQKDEAEAGSGGRVTTAAAK